MTSNELERRVEELEALVEALQRKLNFQAKRLERLAPKADEIGNNGQDSRQARLEKILQHATRMQRDGEDVAMDYSDVMAAAGVSAPTAYSYMDYLENTHDFVQKRKTESGKTRLFVDGSRLNALKHDV